MNMDQAQKTTLDATQGPDSERLTVEIPTEIQAGVPPTETINMEPLYMYNCKRAR